MDNLHITLTLTSDEATTLVHTLQIGTSHRFADGLIRESKAITAYVTGRVQAAEVSRVKKECKKAKGK